jgi:lipopolysaccharide transport system ATP-binding protein
MRGVGKRYQQGGATSLRQRFTGRGGRREWREALRDVDLEVRPGQVLGVVGRNGGGKSTLLRVAAGLTQPSSGSILRRAVVPGLLTLNASASDDLSGADNAVTAAVLAGLSPQEARRRLPEIADFAELDENTMRQPMRTYSDGMKLRLAFAAAASTEPDLLLIDEVLAVGDIAFQEKCLTHVEGLRDRGCGLLIASHVMDHLRRLSTDIVWLRDGRVVAQGPTTELLDSYERSLDERAGPPEAIGGGGYRKGDGRVRITGISCRGTEGAPAGSTVLGGALRVSIGYRREAPVDRAIFSVSLRRVGTADAVVDLTTEASGAGAVPLADEGSVSVTLDRLDLEPGAYWVDVGIYSPDWDVPHDFRWDSVKTLVVGSTTSGAVQPPHRWVAEEARDDRVGELQAADRGRPCE